MKSSRSIIALLLFASSSAFSQAGTAGFQILELGYSAHDLSLGGSANAVTKEPTAVFSNPAGLALDNESGLGFMLTHRTYYGGTIIDMFGTRFDAGSISFGTSLLLSNVPGIEVRIVPSDDPQSTFSAKDFAFAVGAARNFDKVTVGISIMYLYEKLFVYESQGYAGNIGLNYSPRHDVEFGLSAGNLGSSSAMISEKITLPTFVRIGGSYTNSIDDNLSGTGYIGAVAFKSGSITPSVGAELNYRNLLKLRAGYANEINGTNFSTGFSFGAGISYSFLRLDYSYIPMKLDFGNSQTFTLSFIL